MHLYEEIYTYYLGDVLGLGSNRSEHHRDDVSAHVQELALAEAVESFTIIVSITVERLLGTMAGYTYCRSLECKPS